MLRTARLRLATLDLNLATLCGLLFLGASGALAGGVSLGLSDPSSLFDATQWSRAFEPFRHGWPSLLARFAR